MEYYYARNNLEQENALKYDRIRTLNIDDCNIFGDTFSNHQDKPYVFEFLKEKLVPNDVLFVPTLASLGDTTEQILKSFKYLTDKGVKVVALNSEIIDTRQYDAVALIIIETLEAGAEAFKAFRKRRQLEGIKKAKKKGVHIGRPKREITQKIKELARLRKNKIFTDSECAKILDMTVFAFRHIYYKLEKENAL